MQQGNQGNTQSDGAGAAIFCVFLITIMITAGWFLFHDQLVSAVLATNKFFLVVIPFPLSEISYLEELVKIMSERPSVVKFPDLVELSTRVGRFYLPLALGFCAYGGYLVWNDPIRRMSITHDAQTLLERLNLVFPYTSPILYKNLNFDQSKEWESGLPSYLFAKKYKLVQKKKLDKKKAEKILEEQVGEMFEADKLKPHEMALYAVFAARIAKDMDASIDLMNALAASTKKSEHPDYSLAVPLFEKHVHIGQPFLRVHKYTRSLLCSMFLASKLRGKICPGFFLWLKPIDRTLFYSLNRVQAQTPYPEGAGVWNMWQAEQVAFTGKGMIDWNAFLSPEENIEVEDPKPLWRVTVPQFEIIPDKIFVRGTVKALEKELRKIGVIL